MLHPDDRSVLLESLRPPEGFVVDQAIATTYTLDLTALMMAPLAFSLYDSLLAREPRKAGTSSADAVDPYALLKAVREHAERLTVFCQAGYIAAPRNAKRLYGYLEGCPVQVNSKTPGGIFHPKIWVLRFTQVDGDEIRYRFLCASRNLTFDRAWDAVLILDGEYTDRQNAIARNRPLGDFVAALPGMAVSAMDPKRRRSVLRMADELLRVKFEPPPNVEDVRFHPLGIDGYRDSPFKERIGRLLVISPFVTEGALKQLGKPGRDDVLISRAEHLQAMPLSALQAFGEHHTLSGSAELEDEEETAATSDAMADAAATGLHAKVYVADDGWNAHVWLGSANATTAGLERNVEFLVQLTGKKKDLGVDVTLDGVNQQGGLRALLATFTPPPAPVLPDAIDCRLEERLDQVRVTIGSGKWTAVLGTEADKRYPMTLEQRGAGIRLPPGVVVSVRPITLKQAFERPLEPPMKGRVADFGPCSFEAITAFFAFRAQASEGDATRVQEFVVNASVEGAPEDRNGRILQSMLDTPAKFLKFIRILLAGDSVYALEALLDPELAETGSSTRAHREDEGILLEPLLRSLHRDPRSIDAIETVVNDMKGAAAFPPGFESVWQPISAARAARRNARKP